MVAAPVVSSAQVRPVSPNPAAPAVAARNFRRFIPLLPIDNLLVVCALPGSTGELPGPLERRGGRHRRNIVLTERSPRLHSGAKAGKHARPILPPGLAEAE